jgi:hypothetical protein
MNSDKGKSTVVAAMIAASVTILAIGVLNFIGEASEGFKEFLTFWQGMGSLSGKVTLAYALGVLVFLVLFRIKPLGRQSLVTWTMVLYASIAVSSLLLFTPFIDLVL